ncbi:MAG: PRC-barrel domain-containing protein [Verrucomicrobiales bacterium]|nr:PRC-barrel domain-containing protein [Verrucomicrobiales bacterium]
MSILTLTGFAQDTPSSRTDTTNFNRDRTPDTRRADQLHGAVKASEVMGMAINNYQNKKLGKVEELAIDVESGRIVQVILSTGGFLGIGDRLTAVPPGALHYDRTNKVLHLDADSEKLKGAPKFENEQWAEYSGSNHLSSVYGHFGQGDAFNYINNVDASQKDGREAEVQRSTDVPATRDAVRNVDGSADVAQNRLTNDSWETGRKARERQSMIPMSRLGHIQKASKIIGTTVKNHQDESLGKVDNMLVDVQSGRIVAVVVSSGGFLGMGDVLSAIPPTALRFNSQRDTLQIDTTKELLSSAPHFKSTEWPDFNRPGYSDSVYRAYKVEPYFTTNSPAEPDNTARNVRDRNDRTLTPLDQGNSQADTDITAQIRKGILAGGDMSVNAKNVKVITNQGKVTLRGPVDSLEEKRMIADIANSIARSANVDNQLEVR